jgi:hypothetical protein
MQVIEKSGKELARRGSNLNVVAASRGNERQVYDSTFAGFGVQASSRIAFHRSNFAKPAPEPKSKLDNFRVRRHSGAVCFLIK